MEDKILLVNDLPGYGKVALSAMLPVLTHMGFDAYNLPTWWWLAWWATWRSGW